MNDQLKRNFIRQYSDRHYQHATVINHRGTVVAFAMDRNRRIYYTVLNVAQEDPAKGNLDVNYWLNDPALLEFPAEIEQVGYGSLSTVKMPIVKSGTRTEVDRRAISSKDVDNFLSTTARLSAAVPFQVVTDNKYIYLFRQAIKADHPDNVYKLQTGNSSAEKNGKYVTDKDGKKVSLVRATLLVDRYVLSETTLKLAREVRFRRSRNRIRPAASKDSLAARDMEGRSFFEPTKELDFVAGLQDGCFAVTLLPTLIADVERWQIFACNAATQRIDAYNMERDGDGYFNTLGTQLYTSPKDKYKASVLERSPGKCPFTGLALVPVNNPASDSSMQTTSFVLDDRSVKYGLATQLYYEQEATNETGDKHVKQHARLLLCAVTGGVDPYTGHDRQRDYIAAVDFGISRTGTLAEIPGELEYLERKVPLLRKEIKALVAQIAAAKTRSAAAQAPQVDIKTLESDTRKLKSEIKKLESTTTQLNADIRNLTADTATLGNETTRLEAETTMLEAALAEYNKPRYARFFAHSRSHKTGDELMLKCPDSRADLGKWKDEISAMTLDHGVWVQVFSDTHFGRRVTPKTFTSSMGYIGDFWNDSIESLKVLEADWLKRKRTATQNRLKESRPRFREKQSEFNEKQHLLKEKQREFNGKQLLLKEKQREFNEKQLKLSEKQREFNEKQRSFNEQQRELSNMQSLLAAKQTQLNEHETRLKKMRTDPTPDVSGFVLLPSLLIDDPEAQKRDRATNELGSLEIEVPALQEDIRTLEEKVERTRARLRNNSVNVKRLETEIRNLNQDVINSKRQQADANARLADYNRPRFAKFHAHAKSHKTGQVLTLKCPESRADLGDWRDEISALTLDDGVWVQVFSDTHFGNRVTPGVFKTSMNYIGDYWSDSIESLKVFEADWLKQGRVNAQREYKQYTDARKVKESSLHAKQTELADSRTAAHLQRELSSMEARLQKLRDTLRQKKARLAEVRTMRFGKPAALPMPHCNTDHQGLTIASALLGFAYTDAQPALFESGLGRVNMYFKGANQQFFASYYDVRTARAKWSLATTSGAVSIESMMTSSHLNSTIIDVADGSKAELCHLTIKNSESGLTETWPDLPRKVTAFAQVINGESEKQQGPRAPYDYKSATTNRSGSSLANGSLHVVVDGSNANGEVSNGSSSLTIAARGARWIADSPGTTVSFDGKAQYITSDQHRKFSYQGDLTQEAWIKPGTVEGDAIVIHAQNGSEYNALGLRKAQLNSALHFNGTDDSIDLGNPDGLQITGNQTIEMWVKPKFHSGIQKLFFKSEGGEGAILLEPDGVLSYYYGTAGKSGRANAKCSSRTKILANEWSHIAIVRDLNARTLTWYINGKKSSSVAADHESAARSTGNAFLCQNFHGRIDEVRIWNVARGYSDIRANWHRQLSGDEPGLVGYYHFADHNLHDRSGHGHHGRWQGKSEMSLGASPLDAYRCYAVVGENAILSEEAFAAGSWQHFAAVFDQSYALQFNGNDFGDAGNSPMLNITDELTIELFVTVNQIGRKQGLLCKGMMGGGEEDRVPYSLHINERGNLVFAFESDAGKYMECMSPRTIATGTPQYVAVVRKPYTDSTGNEKIRISLMVDNHRLYETFDFNSREGKPKGNNGTLTIGQSYAQNAEKAYLNGIISEVRIWNRALSTDDRKRSVKGNESGLTAWWRMEENDGNVAYDAKGENHIRLTGTIWVKNPDPHASSFQLYRNGQAIKTQSMGKPAGGSDQVTIGARLRIDLLPESSFNGAIEEVRIWETVRTQEQILDNLFSRLRGEKRDLIAYYDFDHITRHEVKDVGLKSNHLTSPAGSANRLTEVLSTAPISNDSAQVRSALAGIKTDFHETISGRPGVTEYADMQRAADGTPHGIHKRCYAYTRNGKWLLSTGYKVGNLITEWIGQAQFDPQVLGYVEGAPPVPSENLTEGFKRPSTSYDGISEVTLVESDSVRYTISSSQEDSYTTSFEAEASFGVGGKISIVMAPFGTGITKEIAGELKSKLKLGMETSGSWSSGESYSAGQTVTRNSSAALGGSWDVPDQSEWANRELTRRYIPSNMGFAFVESETADVYALRIEHTGTLVALRMLPNPDIPKDTNIIPFPINNHYTKQGTLDGRIGFTRTGVALDPDYKEATGYGEYSYFKPKEAYALKKRIEREEQKLKAFYDSFDTIPEGAKMLKALQPGIAELGGAAAVGGAAAMIGGAGGAISTLAGLTLATGLGTTVASAIQHAASDKSVVEKYARRNLVNTYIWTADGGFFEESTQISQVRSTSSSGNYTLSGSATGGFSGGVSGVGMSMSMGLSGTMNGSVNTTRSRNRDAEESFSINIKLALSGDLQKYEYNADGDSSSGVSRVYDKNNNPVKHPGKVDAYRFMTFYIEPNATNFEDLYGKVVDPRWLEESSHPNALALRQANQSDKKPKCWRVFHRVTFVSRILPEFASKTAPPLQKKMTRLNIASNYELVRRLDPFVGKHTADWVGFKDAVKSAVETYLPELSNEEDLEIITEFLADYYGVDRQLDSVTPGHGASTTTTGSTDTRQLGQTGTRGDRNDSFSNPSGVAVAADGKVYVADMKNHRIQIFDGKGTYVDTIGTGIPGPGNDTFRSPWGVAVAADGKLYVADRFNHRIQKFDEKGTYIRTIGLGKVGHGNDGFSSPWGVAVAADGKLYVADLGNSRIQIFDEKGKFIRAIGTGKPGNGNDAFNWPSSVAVAADGKLYVADTKNHRIQILDRNSNYLRTIGTGIEGSGNDTFNLPSSVAVAADGKVYVADTGNHRIQIFDRNGYYMRTIGTGKEGSGDDSFSWPSSVAIAADGKVYVADSGNHRVVIKPG